MKVHNPNDNIYNAVDAVVEQGVVAIEGTKTFAIEYANRIIECLKVYPEIDASIGYQNVANAGYLYYVYNLNKFSIGSKELEKMIKEIDAKTSL